MHNLELNILQEQGCRFCIIEYAKKYPTYRNWQNSPYFVEKIPENGNVGILTGEHSNGLIAIDFDGNWAWQEWGRQLPLGIEQLNTVTWTSGREGRAQMAFMVPKEAWTLIKTFKLIGPLDDAGKTQQLEFRWNGLQSVLPPSMHPDTGKLYEWVLPPSAVLIQELPIEVLEWMINYSPPIEISNSDDLPIEEITIENLTVTQLDECEAILKRIKLHEPKLCYDDWSKITWAAVSHVGSVAGVILMRQFWPEQSMGEYNKLLRHFSLQKSPKFGSLVHRVTNYTKPKSDSGSSAGKINKMFSNNKIRKLYGE
jgi:hypothetical protein